jgi:hypothetical protein
MCECKNLKLNCPVDLKNLSPSLKAWTYILQSCTAKSIECAPASGVTQYQFSVPLSAKPCKDGSPVVKHVPAPVPVPVPVPEPTCVPVVQLPKECQDPYFWGTAITGGVIIGGIAYACSVSWPALCFACWVAREVYGIDNPKWILFRTWLFTKAPDWLRELYIAHGESFAAWIHDKPLIKDMIRFLMDQAIDSLDNDTRELVMNSIQSARK